MGNIVRSEGRKSFDNFSSAFRNASSGQPWAREDFFRPFEQTLDDILNHFEGYGFNNLKQQSGYPRLDVISHDNKFVVEVAIPGVDPADVKVEIHPGEQTEHTGTADSLVVSGKMKADLVREGAHYHVRELSRKSFSRSMYLPKNIQGDPQATFTNGLLTLTWPLVPEVDTQPKVRVITVTSPPAIDLNPV
jgi:HSP20 family molecular chaperone IbpA